MKPHYFEQKEADLDDIMLQMAKKQGYVPVTCLLSGIVVMSEVNKGADPCAGCRGPREKCRGRRESEKARTPSSRFGDHDSFYWP